MPSVAGGLVKVRAHAERTDHRLEAGLAMRSSARSERSIACGAAGGAGRTFIVRSVVELGYGSIFSSSDERAAEHRLLLQRGCFQSRRPERASSDRVET